MHRRPVERFEQSLIQILADENVFADREFVKQHGFLVNGGDPHLVRRFRRRQMNGDRFIEDLPLFGLINTGHDFDQRGFPRAVFADEGGHFAGPEIKLHVLKGAHTGKNLGDPLQRQQWR